MLLAILALLLCGCPPQKTPATPLDIAARR